MIWSCERVQEQLSDYVDGTLDAATTVALSAHLEDCRVCRQEYRALKATVAQLHAMATPDGKRAQRRALANLHQAVAEEAAPRVSMGWRMPLVTASLTVATLLMLVFLSNPQATRETAFLPGVSTGETSGKGLPTSGELDEMASLHAVQSFAIAPGDAVVLQETLADAKSRLQNGTP